jgi:pyruvate/2-oxoglutarate dehydrogenase complex dihydrolipoamide dehydrogenase (E3) component
MSRYDVVIVGSGAAGLTAAMTARRRGARVAMVESRKIGGECTHYGCVPSKSVLAVSRLAEAMKTAPRYGLPGYDPTSGFDFGRVMEHVASVVEGIYLHEQPERFEDMDIDVFIEPRGARFLDPHRLQIGDTVLESAFFVVSTGSSPRRVPDIGALPLTFLDNENFWELRQAPRSVAFLGGGVISVELGQAMARLGVPVTILQRGPRIIKETDPDIGAVVEEQLELDGVRIFTGANVLGCETLGDASIAVHIDQNHSRKQLTVGSVFASLGRIPNVEGLDLDAASVEYSAAGIPVDAYLRTSQPHIYAAGDVLGGAQFTHVAGYQGEVAIDNILGRERASDLSVLPWAIFTDPEVGHVGMNETRARAELGDEVNVLRFDASSDRFQTESRTDGFLKVLLDGEDRLLGAEGVGVHAGEWIQFISMAMQHDLSIADLARTMFVYPTFAELAKKPITQYLRAQDPSDWFDRAMGRSSSPES